MEELKSIVGDNFTLKPLVTTGNRVRNWMRPVRLRMPIPYLLETEGGRRLKLLKSDAESEQFLWIQDVLPFLSKMSFVPEILFSSSEMVLVDYVEGQPANISSHSFSEQVGKIQAEIHNCNVGIFPVDTLLKETWQELDLLKDEGLLDNKSVEQLSVKLDLLKPEALRSSLVYADLKPANMLWTKKNELCYFDLGSFQASRPTDEFLVSSMVYEGCVIDVFRKSYLEAGGTEEFFHVAPFLRLVNRIRLGAYHLQQFAKTPIYDFKMRGRRRKWAKKQVRRLRNSIA